MFPQEIYDHIIDYLHDDIQALKACSLVFRALLSPTRYHLFRSVLVHGNMAEVSRGSILRYVRILRFAPNGNKLFGSRISQVQDAFRYVGSFNNITSLSFSNIFESEWASLDHESISHVGSQLGKLTSLCISTSEFQEVGTFLNLIYAFPDLGRLKLYDVIWITDSISLLRLSGTAQKLKTLELRDCFLCPLLDALHSLSGLPPFEELCLTVESQLQFQSIGRFLHRLGPNLEVLELAFDFMCSEDCLCDAIDLSHNTGLQSVRLVSASCELLQNGFVSPARHFHSVLFRVASPFLEEISLVFPPVTSRAIDAYIDEDSWFLFDLTCVDPRLQRLSRVGIQWPRMEINSRTLAWFKLRLPACNQRGILQFG